MNRPLSFRVIEGGRDKPPHDDSNPARGVLIACALVRTAVVADVCRAVLGGGGGQDGCAMTQRQDLLRELAADIEKYAGLTDREAAIFEAGKARGENKRAWRAFWYGLASGVFVVVVASARWWMA